MGKQAAYRQRCRRDGRCPHCGRSCLPYAECADRRSYKRVSAMLHRGVRYGVFRRVGRGEFANGDATHWGPRGMYHVSATGQAPKGFSRFALAYVRDRGRPATAEDIGGAFIASKRLQQEGLAL